LSLAVAILLVRKARGRYSAWAAREGLILAQSALRQLTVRAQRSIPDLTSSLIWAIDEKAIET
jgi:hypothetical protein